MGKLVVPDIDNETYARLWARAKGNNRSIEAEFSALLREVLPRHSRPMPKLVKRVRRKRPRLRKKSD